MTRSVGVKAKVDRTAIDLFAKHGVDGVSIADIAAHARVSQGALYRHYRSKDEMALQLFSEVYLRTGAELDVIRSGEPTFAARLTAMITHFCGLYDRDPALFRFMLIAQHDFLSRISDARATPVASIEGAIADAVASKDIEAIDTSIGAAIVMGIVLQTAIFHIYGRISGSLTARAPALAHAATAAVRALA